MTAAIVAIVVALMLTLLHLERIRTMSALDDKIAALQTAAGRAAADLTAARSERDVALAQLAAAKADAVTQAQLDGVQAATDALNAADPAPAAPAA